MTRVHRSARLRPALVVGGSLFCWSLAAVAAAGEALLVAEGSVVRREVVALGRDVEVAGEALAAVAAVNGSVSVRGRVGGDVIVLGGDVRLARGGRVEGDVFVLGGRIETGPGATIVGRSVSYPTMGDAWLVLLEGPSLGLSPASRLVLAAKTALLAAWLLWAVVLMATSGSQLLEASRAVRSEPLRSFTVGLAAVVALFLTALLLSGLAATVVSVPLLLLVVGVAVLLKLWGMVAVFHACGRGFVRALPARWRAARGTPLHFTVGGLLVLGALKLVPVAGIWVWTAASLVGVGACLTTKFGRREPWILPPLERRQAGLGRARSIT